MPEHDYDKLEQFFRKAAARTDVTFNEEDWKKLESRLDAQTSVQTAGNKATGVATTIAIAVLLSLSTAIWVSSSDEAVPTPIAQEESLNGKGVQGSQESANAKPGKSTQPSYPESITSRADESAEEQPSQDQAKEEATAQQLSSSLNTIIGSSIGSSANVSDNQTAVIGDVSDESTASISNETAGSDPSEINYSESFAEPDDIKNRQSSGEEINEVIPDDKGQIRALTFEEKISGGDHDENAPSLPEKGNKVANTSDSLERNKQKAVVQLPGAEEEKTREARAMVQKEHASDEKKHVATPRLSLLLSFAPDFSGTSMGLSSAPGKAFGAMLHYHPFERWSISAGAIKNHKRYTGAGEDYKPPTGYWKRNTNGVIPETIDGACDIVEFPVMIQYTAIQNEKSRWNLGAGASSYLMQSESYHYKFGQPNPGARDGWDSRSSSRFMFNMLVFTIGYERQILPGLMLGIEPYAKVPLQEIGWSNLKLFSSGASFTLRYTIVGRNSLSVPTRSRGPD